MAASPTSPPADSPRSGIAFFDLDRTLLSCNSALPWLIEEVRSGNVGPLAALRNVAWLAWHSLGARDVEPVLVRSYAALAGRSARDTERRIAQWYRRVIQRRMRPGGLAAIEEHRARGDRCVLLTTATQHLSNLVARDLALDDALCTLLEVDAAGRFTGRVVGRPCFGPGKVIAASNWAAAARVPLSACTFYSDSASDVPVLEMVGTPVVVHPDPRLRRVARARGWRIVHWGRGRR